MMKRVFVGLGSSEGDRVELMAQALRAIEQLSGTAVLRVSNVVESEPWGGATEALFANAVAEIDTPLEADDLLEAFREIEVELGRLPGPRFGSRPIDLDILLVEDEEWDTPELVVPHPRLTRREFVVRPLLEIEPHAALPDGTPIGTEDAVEGPIIGVLGPVPGYEDRTPPVVAPAEEVDEWRPLLVLSRIGHREVRPDADVIFVQMVLDQEGIPWAWDPFPPEDSSNPWGLAARFKLMVPAGMHVRAARLVAEVRAAAPDWGEMATDGEASPEDSSPEG